MASGIIIFLILYSPSVFASPTIAAFRASTVNTGGKFIGMESISIGKESMQFCKPSSGHQISQLEKGLSNWLGKETKAIKNKAGDSVFLSKNGTRRVRFDLNHPAPHTNPHGHIEEFINGKWNKSGPIYPIDVSHY